MTIRPSILYQTYRRGFTIVELIVVIVAVGILAGITTVAYNGVQARGRDTARRADVDRLVDALAAYEANNGNALETGSGCGANGNGTGWALHENGTTYPKSISNCLKDAGYLSEPVKDPSGATTSTPTSGYTYMKYHCGSGTSKRIFVYAKLETLPQDATATDSTCSTIADSSYGMNYFVQVP